MRLMITGSRAILNARVVAHCLNEALKDVSLEEIECLISGACAGVDRLAEQWARAHGIRIERYPPDWKRLGRRAGFVRNAEMVATATHVVGVCLNESRGTMHAVDLAEQQGKLLHLYKYDDESYKEICIRCLYLRK